MFLNDNYYIYYGKYCEQIRASRAKSFVLVRTTSESSEPFVVRASRASTVRAEWTLARHSLARLVPNAGLDEVATRV